MRTAAGTCLLTNVTHNQVDDLEEALAVRVPSGWAFPEALVTLRDSIDGTESEMLAEPSHPPCIQCGAMTESEAESKCFGRTVDDCHGNRLWP